MAGGFVGSSGFFSAAAPPLLRISARKSFPAGLADSSDFFSAAAPPLFLISARKSLPAGGFGASSGTSCFFNAAAPPLLRISARKSPPAGLADSSGFFNAAAPPLLRISANRSPAGAGGAEILAATGAEILAATGAATLADPPTEASEGADFFSAAAPPSFRISANRSLFTSGASSTWSVDWDTLMSGMEEMAREDVRTGASDSSLEEMTSSTSGRGLVGSF